jgi:asparagine synthase (glutamine-hydrolysing)
MHLDQLTYLPGDLLTKVDRCSMAHGLEVRVPYLDNAVLDYASRTPLGMKIQGSQGKLILNDVLAYYLPKRFWQRPKEGFGVPLDKWLSTLRLRIVHDYLGKFRVEQQGIFNWKAVNALTKRYYAGDLSLRYKIWNLLMFQLWFIIWQG